ncbi:MAG: hypothetical protein V3S02_03510 [Dehalococcoidales bacterium]
MKAKYANRTLIVITGAIIGMIIAYFSAGSANTGNLVTGAFFGSALGFYFMLSRQPGIG